MKLRLVVRNTNKEECDSFLLDLSPKSQHAFEVAKQTKNAPVDVAVLLVEEMTILRAYDITLVPFNTTR